MADKTNDKINLAPNTVPQKTSDNSKSKKSKEFFLVRWWKGLVRWFKELKSEAKKVTWPTFKQVCKSTLVVAVVTVIIGAIVIVADLIFRNGLELFVGLF